MLLGESQPQRRHCEIVSMIDVKGAVASMTQTNPPASKRLMWIFLAFVVLMIAGISAVTMLLPYESGVLMPAAGSGNLSFGGHLGAHNDLLYFRTPEGGLSMKDTQTNQVTPICDGDCSFINAGDEWVYLIRNGDIVRLPLGNAVEPQIVVGGEQCRGLSVNGPWIYYTDGQGRMFKLRTDGSKKTALGNTLPMEQFTVDNRRVVFLSDGVIYAMLTDGTGLTTVAGERAERFLYTNDSLYYYEDGVIRRVCSLVGALDEGNLYFTSIPAKVFNFEVVQDGSKLYYAGEEGIVELLLQTPVQASEQKTVLCPDTDVASLYLTKDMIYYFDAQGVLHELDPELAVTGSQPGI